MSAALPWRSPAFWIASGFGSGLAPRAPGTVGTLAALLPWWWLQTLPLPSYLLALGATFVLGTWAAQRTIDQLNRDDPGLVVIDEWVGVWIALAALPVGWPWLVAGVLLFRVFDILKPWPVGWADRRLKGGLGTMLDDVLAGGCVLALLQAAAWLVADGI